MKPFLEFIFNHWELCLALGILLVLLFIYEIKTQRNQAPKLSPQEAVMLINQDETAAIFDLRDAEQFSKGHMIHAINVNQTEHHAKKFTPYKEKPIILVCQNGETSQKVATQWMQAGYSNLHVMTGGINAWQDAGFPLI